MCLHEDRKYAGRVSAYRLGGGRFGDAAFIFKGVLSMIKFRINIKSIYN